MSGRLGLRKKGRGKTGENHDSEPHLFAVQKTIKQREYTLIVPIYVDDLFPISNKILTNQFEEYIGKYLNVTILGNASFFLGIHVTRNRTAIPPSLTINQEVYAISILEKHNVDMNKISCCSHDFRRFSALFLLSPKRPLI